MTYLTSCACYLCYTLRIPHCSRTWTRSLPPSRSGISECRTRRDRIISDLASTLGALHGVVIVPAIGVEADAEREGAVVLDGGVFLGRVRLCVDPGRLPVLPREGLPLGRV
jgi:hypothetical protein